MKYIQNMEQVHISAVSDALACQPMAFISDEETIYRQKICAVRDLVTEKHIHLLLVTGPSASGKTTSAEMVAREIRSLGKKVSHISLDNFYKSPDLLPRWEDGYQNYESIEGLDIPYFKEVVTRLLDEGHAQFPLFDFTVDERRAETTELFFDEHTYLIIEGIHALNPLLTDTLKPHRSIKVYISSHSDFVDDMGNVLLGARDMRLVRRMLRDFNYRDIGAEETLQMWDYVLKGEDLYIRPFRRYADVHLNSTHKYEPFLYRDTLLTLLRKTPADSPHREMIDHLIDSTEHFFGIDPMLIPKSSLIQEFIKQEN